MGLAQLLPDLAVSFCQSGHLGEVVSPELNDLYLPVEAGLDDVLQHLVLTALTVDVEQVQVPRSSSHIVKNSGSIDDFQRNLLSFFRLVIFHSEGSLAFKVSLGKLNDPVSVAQTILVKGYIPLISLNVVVPNSLQIFIKIRNWLVNVELTETLFKCFTK